MRQFSHLIGRLFDYFKTISQNIFDLIFRESVFAVQKVSPNVTRL